MESYDASPEKPEALLAGRSQLGGIHAVRVSRYVNRTVLNQALEILFIPIVAFIISLKFQEFFNINLFLIIVALVFILKAIFLDRHSLDRIRLNALDWSLLLVGLIELVGFWTTSYRANSFYYLTEVLFFLLFYYLVRFNLKHEYQRVALFLFIALWGLFLSGIALYYFIRLHARLNALGFSEITDFRNHIYLLNPTGVSVGEWATIFFLLLPFPLILFVKFRRSRLAGWLLIGIVIGILLAMSITMIRGVYIAMAAFFVIGTALFYCYGIFPLKKLLFFDVFVILTLVICLIPVTKPVLTTLSMFKTTSQVRSLEGRKSVWRDSLKMIKEYPWFGVGAGNFTMQYVGHKEPGNDAAFAIRPFNYFLQILIEKGVTGLFCYGLLLFSFFRVSHQKVGLLGEDIYRKSVVILFMAACATILVRDLSESSVLTNRGVNVLLWFIFANNARLED